MSEPLKTPEQVIALIDRADAEVSALCSGKRRWTMTVPAEHDRDSDLVIGGALHEARRLLAAIAVPAGLDVERLARAMARFDGGDNHTPEDAEDHWPSYLDDARRLAREYAAIKGNQP